MGIVAQCPNGHRIKVKDQFAGKKVICPHCQAPFRVAAPVPAADAPKSLPLGRIVPLDPAIVATLPRAYALDAVAAAAPKPSQPVVQQPVAAPIVGTSLSMTPAEPPVPAPEMVPPAAAAFPPPWHPLIAEVPQSTWSVAWPGGEPSAPMPADVMQQWLDSRQAKGGELVWRSDWPDWLPIAQVFPEYMPPAPL